MATVSLRQHVTLADAGRSHPDRILLVDDDAWAGAILERELRAAGYAVERESDARHALLRLSESAYDLLLVSSGRWGVEALCRAFRSLSRVPLVIVAGEHTEATVVAALRSGADHVLPKPYSIGVAVESVRSLIRRSALDRAAASAVLCVGDLEIDAVGDAVAVGGRALHLTRSEFRLLRFLAERAGVAQPRARLVGHLWGSEHVGGGRACDLHVMHLRRKLGDDLARPRRIVSVRGVGYRLDAVTASVVSISSG